MDVNKSIEPTWSNKQIFEFSACDNFSSKQTELPKLRLKKIVYKWGESWRQLNKTYENQALFYLILFFHNWNIYSAYYIRLSTFIPVILQIGWLHGFSDAERLLKIYSKKLWLWDSERQNTNKLVYSKSKTLFEIRNAFYFHVPYFDTVRLLIAPLPHVNTRKHYALACDIDTLCWLSCVQI